MRSKHPAESSGTQDRRISVSPGAPIAPVFRWRVIRPESDTMLEKSRLMRPIAHRTLICAVYFYRGVDCLCHSNQLKTMV
jgi:hypothetical protein